MRKLFLLILLVPISLLVAATFNLNAAGFSHQKIITPATPAPISQDAIEETPLDQNSFPVIRSLSFFLFVTQKDLFGNEFSTDKKFLKRRGTQFLRMLISTAYS